MHKAVSSFLETLNADLSTLTYLLLLAGSAATLFQFDVKDHSYVLRILPSHANHLTRMHEIQLAQCAGEMGVGPKMHFVDPHLEAHITDFIPGRTVHPRDFQNTYSLERFAQLLQKLHRSSLKFPVACSPFQRFHNFLEKREQRGLALSPKLSKMKRVMETIEAVFQLHEIPLVPCHLDLHSSNIMLVREDFLLVDWVNGGFSNPYFDLATFAIFHGLNDLQMRAFLTHYFGHPLDELEWSLFIVAQPVRLFVIAIACLSAVPEEITFYNDGLVNFETTSLRDYIHMDANEKINLSPWKIGLIMLKAGLNRIEGKNFKNSLQYLQDAVLRGILEKQTGA